MADEATQDGLIPVVITVDTEPDNAWDWHLDPSVANVGELLRLHELLLKYSAKATCLITYTVVGSDEAVKTLETLEREGGAEIGAHLHPWENPPFSDSGEDVKYSSYPHDLSPALFEDKMSTLTEAITERMGQPTSYRAGRWGLAADHLRVLERLGYQVDTSVTPLIDWRTTMGIPRSEGGRGGIDYRFAPQHPYHPAYDAVCREGDAKILEIPLSVGFTRATPASVRRAYGAFPVIAQRVLRKSEILRPVWAVPPEQSKARLLRMIETLLQQGTEVINMAIHSSELMEGGSPSSRTREATDEVFDRLDAMLAALASSGRCAFTTLTEASQRWTAAHEANSEPAAAIESGTFGDPAP